MLRFFVHWSVRLVVLLLVMLGMFVVLGHGSGIKERIGNLVFEQFMKMKPRNSSGQMIFLDIDDESLSKLGQWPLPRFYMAQIIRNLTESGAQVIVFDGVLAEADRSSPAQISKILPVDHPAQDALSELSDYDVELAVAIKESKRFVAGFTHGSNPKSPMLKGRILAKKDVQQFILDQKQAGGMYFIRTAQFLPDLQKAAAGNGSFMAALDDDAVIRKTGLIFHNGKQIYPALLVEALRLYDSDFKSYPKLRFNADVQHNSLLSPFLLDIGKYNIPVDENGEMWVSFRRMQPEEQISAHYFVDDYYDPDRFDIAGKAVFIASEAEGLKDLRATPLGNVAGVKIHMNAFEQILQGDYLLRNERSLDYEVFGALGVCALLILLSFFVHPMWLFAIASFSVVGAFWGAWQAFDRAGYLFDPVVPSMMIICIFVASALFRFLRSEIERQQVRSAFGLYISPDFMKELTGDPNKLTLGGEIRDLSVMFTDIRGFTTISEGLSPEELIALMNDFLTPMSDIVMQNRGTIDKYMGDAMMAFWNAPLDDADHARHACLSALAMTDALAPINERQKDIAKAAGKEPLLLRAGIGVNTGPCAVGNMGSKQRFAYSTLGDAVNLASRLEGQTKAYGVDILIGHETYIQISDFAVLELDLIQVKGKKKPERIYALIGDNAFMGDAKFIALKKLHEDMLLSYRAQQFEQAIEFIAKAKNIGVEAMNAYYDIFKIRCEDYMKSPPPENWDGVYIATSK